MRGQAGVGSLLIFLSTIVVAVLAATVFISTASSLQQKAFAVGMEAKERVSATFDVEAITGIRDSSDKNRTIHNITLVVRLAPGAEPIKLDDNGTIIQILTPKWQVLSIQYGGNVTGSGKWPEEVNETEKFYVWEDQSIDRDGIWRVMSPGEVYTFVIALNETQNHTITEELPVTIKILSRTGISTIVKFRAPTVIKDEVVPLYP